MEILGRAPDLISGAIVTMCGQNVGQGRSTKASIGLTLMNWGTSLASGSSMMSIMLKEGIKNGHIPEDLLISMILRTGSFFNQASN